MGSIQEQQDCIYLANHYRLCAFCAQGLKKDLDMLVLTRRINEKLIIGDNISILVAGVSGQQVRLAIDAPKDVVVDREEIFVKKQSDSKEDFGNR